jgi:hypothetical protein
MKLEERFLKAINDGNFYEFICCIEEGVNVNYKRTVNDYPPLLVCMSYQPGIQDKMADILIRNADTLKTNLAYVTKAGNSVLYLSVSWNKHKNTLTLLNMAKEHNINININHISKESFETILGRVNRVLNNIKNTQHSDIAPLEKIKAKLLELGAK